MAWKESLELARYIYQVDPACRSVAEAFFLYPVIKVLRVHRRAHWLYQRGHYTLARWLSQRARKKTGIEIHPGAKIGRFFFIDHGSGVVIGETAVIGDYVTIYHQVTLGGRGQVKGSQRHPILGDRVLVGAGASILGPVQVGSGAKVGAASLVMTSVPAGATAVGVPARIIPPAGDQET